MPWHGQGRARPVNALTGKLYHGVNVIALWAAAEACGYRSGFWATYKQWQSLGAQVRKGEKASLIVFYKELEREVADEETAEPEIKTCLFVRSSFVFNADQVDGWAAPEPAVCELAQALEQEAFVAATGADIRHGGERAYYNHRPTTSRCRSARGSRPRRRARPLKATTRLSCMS